MNGKIVNVLIALVDGFSVTVLISHVYTGLFTLNDVKSMVDEIIKMQDFNHRHVLSLIGVCLEPSVSMVMPFMTNGCLLDYLKRERSNLEVKAEESEKVGVK